MSSVADVIGSHPVTLEAQYVKKTVGPALKQALAEIVEKRPADPVEYLANFLLKYSENKRLEEIERENQILVEKLQKEKEEEEKRQEEMRLEAERIRLEEEELRREAELEERRKRELEELAKRKEEIANLAPALPSLAEEEDQIVEFGQTKLHELAAQEGANLSALIKQNYNSIAARNSESKTARDVANELNLADNVKQIDESIWELVELENYKQLTDLAILGFDELTSIIEAKFGSQDEMIEKGLQNQAEQLYTVLPSIQAKIREISNNIEANDLEALKTNADQNRLLFSRDAKGKSPLHKAIERQSFEIATYLLEKSPILAKINDSAEKYPLDYLKEIDASTLEEADAELYESLTQKLSA